MQNFKPFFIYWLSLYASVQAPYREGDVILGGEVPVHSPISSEGECGELFTSGLARVLAIIYAIEKINNDSTLLPNITLGYDIRDYCERLPRATKITFDFVKNDCNTNVTNHDMKKKKSIVAVIGPTESRMAIAVAGILQTLNASGISPSATSAELRSHDYKHLFRMAPSDSFRSKAMADLVEHFKWTYVAAVGQDDSFGRNGVWSVVKEAAARNNSFCVAFTELIPSESRLSSIRNIVTKLRRHENIRVVILWLYGSYEKHFLSEVNRQNLTGRVWILSDAFTSLAQACASTLVGSIAIQPHNFYDTRFEGHRNGLTMVAIRQYFPEWWGEIRKLLKKCSASKGDEMKMEPCFQDFVQNLRISYTPYVIGIIITLLSFAVTCKFWNTPIVKASNREFSLVVLVSILLLLTLVVINLFEPTDTICKIIYPWRYITYSLCLSFLLVKILRISSAFQVPLTKLFAINSLTNRMQGMIIITLHILLLLVLLLWLFLDPPIKKKHIVREHYIFIECRAYKSAVGKTLFLLTCSYLLFQTLFSAFCFYKIRNIPENFSEAKRIAFSMYMFLFSVLAYHPVEFSMDGWYVTVVDCVTTLLSAYGFICCILLPKLYIILFKPELNTLASVRQEVTQFSFGSSSLHVNPIFHSSIQCGT